MTNDQFDELYDTLDQRGYDMFEAHMNYISEHYDPSERTICDGDSLIVAAEEGYLYEEFRKNYIAHF